MKKIFIFAEGCKRRLLDAKRVHDYLLKNNYVLADKPEDADIILLFTCAASEEAAKYALSRVKELQKYNAELIVTGCLPAIEKEKLDRIFGGKRISTKDLDDLDSLFPENKISYRTIDDANIYIWDLTVNNSKRKLRRFLRKIPLLVDMYIKTKDYIFEALFDRHSIFHQMVSKSKTYCIRISWGCLSKCSYCVIKKGVGVHKSKSLNECIKEFKDGLGKGYKNFVLTADDTGAYGLDIGSSFTEILDEITKILGDYEISIRATNPNWVVKYIDELEEIIKRRKITIFDIDIQSGNSRILKLMNRYSDIDKIKDALKRLKNSFPDLSLSTHIIVGFPSETKEEFIDSLNFVTEMGYRSGALFPFSEGRNKSFRN